MKLPVPSPEPLGQHAQAFVRGGTMGPTVPGHYRRADLRQQERRRQQLAGLIARLVLPTDGLWHVTIWYLAPTTLL